MPSGVYKRSEKQLIDLRQRLITVARHTGPVHSEEQKAKWRRDRKGIKLSNETKEKIRLSLIGRVVSVETRNKIGEANSASLVGVAVNGNNGMWRGDAVSYSGLHKWVNRKIKKIGVCHICRKLNIGKRSFHLANISHTYKRDLGDWVELCASCNIRYDRGSLSLDGRIYAGQ